MTPKIVATFRYRGMLMQVPICYDRAKYDAIMAQHFPDGVIDWEIVQTLPHVLSTPEERTAVETLLDRRYRVATLQPSGRV